MAKENTDVLPVVSKENNNSIIGILSYREIIASYKKNMDEHVKKHPDISLKRRGLKILLRGQKLMTSIKIKDK
jgi:predicted transcriptional regulator